MLPILPIPQIQRPRIACRGGWGQRHRARCRWSVRNSPPLAGAVDAEGLAEGAALDEALTGCGDGDVKICPGLGVGLDEELRFLRMELVLSRIECLTTTFCSLNSMTNSFC